MDKSKTPDPRPLCLVVNHVRGDRSGSFPHRRSLRLDRPRRGEGRLASSDCHLERQPRRLHLAEPAHLASAGLHSFAFGKRKRSGKQKQTAGAYSPARRRSSTRRADRQGRRTGRRTHRDPSAARDRDCLLAGQCQIGPFCRHVLRTFAATNKPTALEPSSMSFAQTSWSPFFNCKADLPKDSRSTSMTSSLVRRLRVNASS